MRKKICKKNYNTRKHNLKNIMNCIVRRMKSFMKLSKSIIIWQGMIIRLKKFTKIEIIEFKRSGMKCRIL